jgi:signal transduction histidine kinase
MKCLNNRRLLVVDDQEVIHFSFRTAFGGPTRGKPDGGSLQEGYDVDYTSSGEKGLEILRRGMQSDEPHSLAFVDMYMPQGWDGVETITRFWETSPDLQIVVCTAFTDYSWSQIIARLGKVDQLLILKKPFDKIEVRQLARALTEKWRLSRQVRTNVTSLEEAVAERTGELARANARLVDLNREIVAARDAAQSADRAKTEFLANVSHEIRTPMTSILGYADLLGDRDCPVDRRREAVATVRRHANHLLEMIDGLLDISKLEAGKLTVQRTNVAPRELALEVSSLLNVRAEERRLRLAVEFHGDLPQTIDSDPRRLRQILLNLVGNAIKFTEIGEVRLGVRMLDGADHSSPRIAFEVIDTGIGIAAEQLPHLFDCFHQSATAARRQFGGMGLGLAISMRLARMLGGDIQVTSGPGAGSTFRLVLPVSKAAEVGSASRKPAVCVAQTSAGGQVREGCDSKSVRELPVNDRERLTAADVHDVRRDAIAAGSGGT